MDYKEHSCPLGKGEANNRMVPAIGTIKLYCLYWYLTHPDAVTVFPERSSEEGGAPRSGPAGSIPRLTPLLEFFEFHHVVILRFCLFYNGKDHEPLGLEHLLGSHPRL